MSESAKCVVCGSPMEQLPDIDNICMFLICPVCGKYEIGTDELLQPMNYNHLAPYLLYHRFESRDPRYHTTLSKDTCDMYREQYDSGNREHGRPVHMDAEMVETWYPLSFMEKIDKILLYLGSRSKHIGEIFLLSYEEMISALFVDRYDYDLLWRNSERQDDSQRQVTISSEEIIRAVFAKRCGYDQFWSNSERQDDSQRQEAAYILDYLKENHYITYSSDSNLEKDVKIRISPAGYSRIDALQKHMSNSRDVLVAMKFGNETRELREAIRKGIEDAKYVAIFIDEVQHNDLITPELLKHIRDSKFVVVDLTHQNNGAYFEEGYAMGLGKQVIQLCQENTKLHFDIAQKNTIMWAKESDIPERLTNRIKATIE